MPKMKAECLLGIEDEPVRDSGEGLLSYETNKIGGQPNWPGNIRENPRCRLCGFTLPLLVQIYSPLEISPNHRTLYVFGCVNPPCFNKSESWLCLRCECPVDHSETPSTQSASSVQPASTVWLDDADDWGDAADLTNSSPNDIGNNNNDGDNAFTSNSTSTSTSDVDLSQLSLIDPNANASTPSPVGAEAPKLTETATADIEEEGEEAVSVDTPERPSLNIFALLSSPVTPSSLPASLRPIFKSFYLDVIEEAAVQLGEESLQIRAKELLAEYQQREGFIPVEEKNSQGSTGGGSQELYEKGHPSHGDKLAHKFIMRVQQLPSQLIRYCREDGAALPLQPIPEHSVPPCAVCKSPRVFEIQVMPFLSRRLYSATSHAGEIAYSIEFGTALVYTCAQSCWISGQDTYREEFVVVQKEPL